MCGRMTLTKSGSEIAEYFALAMAEEAVTEMDGTSLRPRYNIAPSQPIATIDHCADERPELHWKQWGLVPSWSKDPRIVGKLFNARSETASEKPSFRAAWKRRRCLVVADGFYEWTPRARDHQPYHFSRGDGSLLAFAGLYEEWLGEGGELIESCTVLTTAASADLEGVHHRMPVILVAENFGAWLGQGSDPEALKALMQPAPSGTLEKKAVGRTVNNPRHDDPSCLLPASATSQADAVDASREATPKSLDRDSEDPSDQAELFGPDPEVSK
ncbi:MAG: SOS response-associated peptidase [Myxococcales bacterium]|nr:SOS response-associated peptidase [Myxococcales bacterium]HIK86222.1 SOS response-associated peptidase [Myxococcales bacterium]